MKSVVKITGIASREIESTRTPGILRCDEENNEQPFMERCRFQFVLQSAYPRRKKMRTIIIAVSAIALMGTAPVVFAQGVSSTTPGQEMQTKAAKKGHPAGHKMHAMGSKKSHPAASTSAPGQTTGSSTKRSY
ncbi:hypothetical protein AYJ54_14595 [Bradyrhizobium centrolobii]|uniref:Uncharacterized protein n=1 Tax=Bradyrhizobium centrolobii TaxID=1505087 RepID=A0A176YMF4_9BRAD|nr:hypothetical protein [Bradyrhizobium centrolobii]OAF08333.1 hypothetical protein AYJ54_14595 [Bradyrhizobium centrolobii]